jgi:CDP-glycerol glycerophosphotransferase (TagB/SpsB family)
MRVGFLFNHYAVHQVPHAAPYAFELSRNNSDFEVIIACSSDEQLQLAEKIGALYPGHHCTFKRLDPHPLYRLADPIVSRWTFGRKTLVLYQNLDFFRSLDVLVAPERHCMCLRSRFNLDNLTMIHTRHGAGDREGGFDERSGVFDLTILPGQKYVDRLTELGYLKSNRFAVAGWPKFEVVKGLRPEKRRLFDNDNPVVVYNPHFDQTVSSWQDMGLKVFEFFAENRDYNLIFAPHVVLFMRDKRHKASLPRKFEKLPNVLIDKGSSASSDMTYIRAADLYLGDVSSQVYEFLLEPRPCVFLNGHGIAWKNDPYYFHWNLGQVVSDIDKELRAALDCAKTVHPDYLSQQKAAFEYTFHVEPDTTAAQRGATAIADFLNK